MKGAQATLREWFAGSESRRRVLVNSGWLIFDRGIRAVAGLLVGAWMARYLGPSQFGLLSYALAFTALFQAIANLGADAIVVRDIARDHDAAAEILGTVLALRLTAGGICWMLCVSAVAVLTGDRQTVVLTAIIAASLVFQSADTVDLWFQSQMLSRLTVVAKLGALCLSTALKVVLILVEAPLAAFAAVVALDVAACALAMSYVYRLHPTAGPWKRVRQRALPLLKESWPLLVSGLSIMIYMRIDQIVIKQILGDTALGIYAAALPLSQIWQVLPMTLITSLAPFITRRKAADEASYQRLLVLVFRGFFYLGVGVTLLTWLISEPLVRLLFGTAFSEAVQVANIHVASNIFCFLGLARSLWLINERRFAVLLCGTLLAGATGILLNWLLLPRIGVVGAAWTAIAVQFVACFLINLVLEPKSFRMQLEAIFFWKS
ncbi:flippase [Povalibacter sp.]|uniref:flippase n=1 Tax=Povalibacter sp. TaxID=1962978 RepID=UPI002F3FD23B